MAIQTTYSKPVRFDRQPYKVIKLRTADQVVAWWPFLREGWQEVCSPVRGNGDLSLSEFLGVVLEVTQMPPSEGLVAIFTSKNDKPLGFVVVRNDSETAHRRTCVIYIGYSNKQYRGAPEVATDYVHQWAKQNHFSELHAQSRRLNGSAMRFFRRKLGFKVQAVVMTKSI